jgi:hypothetical protein
VLLAGLQDTGLAGTVELLDKNATARKGPRPRGQRGYFDEEEAILGIRIDHQNNGSMMLGSPVAPGELIPVAGMRRRDLRRLFPGDKVGRHTPPRPTRRGEPCRRFA